MNTAAVLAECVVCFDDLYKEQCAVFTKKGKRTCPHFFHSRCVQSLPSKNCPLCRKGFDAVLDVPDLDSAPEEWFRVVDLNGDGRLSQKEVMEVFKAQLPVDIQMLEGELPGMWAMWDTDHNGSIDKHELIRPNTGLMAYVRANVAKRSTAQTAPANYSTNNYHERNNMRPPDIRTHRGDWFRHFDYDNSGELDKDEVVRALIKTFNMSTNTEKVDMVRNVVDAVWVLFDDDGSGGIDMAEFLRPEDGLADTIVASMQFS